MDDDISRLSKGPVPEMGFELSPLDLETMPGIDLDSVPNLDFTLPDIDFDFPDATQENES
jgi:hypothetical protein